MPSYIRNSKIAILVYDVTGKNIKITLVMKSFGNL